MAKEIMRRSAADNPYLHQDFHMALNCGIDYLHRRYGEEAVREYLRLFTRSFYAPLIKDINDRGLTAIKEHLEHIYTLEEGRVSFNLTQDALSVEVAACPAVLHMRENGVEPDDLFVETERTVNETLATETPYAYELQEYDKDTGRSRQRYYRRPL